MERMVCPVSHCATSSLRNFRRLLTLQSDADRAESTFACHQELPALTSGSKSILDVEAIVVDRICSSEAERCGGSLCGGAGVAASRFQPVVVVSQRLEVSTIRVSSAKANSE